MTNGNDSAFIFNPGWHEKDNPLTKREYFAACAMSGMLSNELMSGSAEAAFVATDAVEQADALIDALNKTK